MLATALPVAAGFVAGAAAHGAALKPAVQASMLLEPATTGAVADLAPMTLLAKSSADAAIDSVFAAVWPLSTLASGAFVLNLLIQDQSSKDGSIDIKGVGAISGFFLFICWALFYPAFQ